MDKLFEQIIMHLEDGVTNGIRMGSMLDQVNEEEEEKDEQSKNERKKKVEFVEEREVIKIPTPTQVPVSQPNIILNSR